MILNHIYNEDNLETCARMPDEIVDLVVTSPPYDNLRKYDGYTWAFEVLAEQLFRVVKKGGVVVWVIGDATIDGNETGSSFRQALFFKAIGFNLHDTMIWRKTNPMPMDSRIPRYVQSFEYMFVLSKGTPTCNHIRDKCTTPKKNNYPARRENGHKTNERVKSAKPAVREDRVRHNVWNFPVHGATDQFSRQHPATFPEALARDHIISWSNPGEIVYDPFMGSGTTAKAAQQLGRQWIGSEASSEYAELARKRLEACKTQEDKTNVAA